MSIIDMTMSIAGKRVAILVADGFEQIDLCAPRDALEATGAETELVAPQLGEVRGWDVDDWGALFEIDVALTHARADEYDALIVPGGVLSAERLRGDDEAIRFAAHFLAAGKPVAAIGHGVWMLVETGALDGRELTGASTVRTDLKNAGATWIDRDVVVDHGLVTSRDFEDMQAFVGALIDELAMLPQLRRVA